MKKFLILVLVVMIGLSLVSSLKAEDNRTITRKTKACTTGVTLVTANGATLYRITGYASSANSIYAISDFGAATGAISSSTVVKVEGGEATQYDTLTQQTFGDEGLSFTTGIVVIASGCTVVVEYI